MDESRDRGPGSDHDVPYVYDLLWADWAHRHFLRYLVDSGRVTDWPDPGTNPIERNAVACAIS